MSKLSFIIVTNQDYSSNAKVVVDSILRFSSYQNEILVCSPSKIEDSRVKWIEDKTDGNGWTVTLYNKAYLESTGDFIFILNDDCYFPCDKPLRAIDYLKSEKFANRKYKVTSIGAGPGLTPDNGTCVPSKLFPPPYELTDSLNSDRFTKRPYKYLIMGFPVFERDTVEKYFGGFLLNPSFRHHYADNWLPFFIGETDGEPLILDDTSLERIPNTHHKTNTTHDLYDYTIFTKLVDKILEDKNEKYYLYITNK